MELAVGKKIYFLSDFHLGAPNRAASLVREKKVVAFLESIRHDAEEIFIVGDIFDFWFEYKTVVPRGFTRLFGKLAELSDAGIKLHVFVGNHDMWMCNYFQEELNIPVYFEPQIFNWNGKQFFIGHGDGLGPSDHGFKFIKKYSAILFVSICLVCCIPTGVLVWRIILAGRAERKQEILTNCFWELRKNGSLFFERIFAKKQG